MDTIQEAQPTSGKWHYIGESISLEDCASMVAAEETKYDAAQIQKYLHGRNADSPELSCYGWTGVTHATGAHNYKDTYRLEMCMLQQDYSIDSRKYDSNYKIAPEYMQCRDVEGLGEAVGTEAECKKACATFTNSPFSRKHDPNYESGCVVMTISDFPERLGDCYWNTYANPSPTDPKARSLCRKKDDCIDPVDGHPNLPTTNCEPGTKFNGQPAKGSYHYVGRTTNIEACASAAASAGYTVAQVQRYHGDPMHCYGWSGDVGGNAGPSHGYFMQTCKVLGKPYYHVGRVRSLDECATTVVRKDTSYVAAQIQRKDGTDNEYDCYAWPRVANNDFRNNRYHATPYKNSEVASCMLNPTGQLTFTD